MRDKIRDIVVQAVAGTKDLTESIDELHALLDDRQSEQLFRLRDNCVNGVDDEVCRNSGICKYCS